MPDPTQNPSRLPPSPIMLVAISFAAGIAAGESLSAPWGACALLAVAASLLFLALRKLRIAAAFLLLAAVTTGAFHHRVRSQGEALWNVSSAAPPTGAIVRARAVVVDEPRRIESKKESWLNRTSTTVELTDVRTGDGWKPVRARALLTIYSERAKSNKEADSAVPSRGASETTVAGDDGTGNLKRGTLIEFTGTLKRIGGPRNPGAFDYRKHYARKGIGVQITVKSRDQIEPAKGRSRHPLHVFAGFVRERARTAAKLARLSDADTGLLMCLVAGERDAVSPDVEEVLSRAGIMHFFVVSGLHVGLIAGALFFALRALGVREWIVAVASGILAFLYVTVTGFNSPAVRALIMIVAVLARILLGRHGSSWDALALSALVILLYAPSELFSVGFQLSFTAVVFILLLYRPIFRRILSVVERLPRKVETREERRRARKVARLLASPLAVSAAAWLGVWPLIARTFHLVTPLAILANLIYVPLFFLALITGLVFLALSLIAPVLAVAPALLAGKLVSLIFRLTEAIAGFRFSHFYVASVPAAFIWTYFVAVALFLLAGKLERARRLAGRIGLAAAVVILFLLSQLPKRGFSFEVLDVGHGLSAAVLTEKGGTIVFDCGSARGARSACDVLSDFLWEKGRRSIDLLVLSHGDRDHTNGVPGLLERFAVKEAFLGPHFDERSVLRRLLERRSVRVTVVDGPRKILAGGMSFSLNGGAMLEGRRLSSNDASVAMRFTSDGKTYLLLGDQQDDGLALLLQDAPRPVDVLLLPHHGLPVPTLETVFEVFSPRIAVASRGSGDDASLLEALRAQGKAMILTTAESAAIEVRTLSGELRASGCVSAAGPR